MGAGSSKAAWLGDTVIRDAGDVARVLADVNAAAVRRGGTAALAHAVRTVDDVALDVPDLARVVPVAREIADSLLPWPGGLRRGCTVAAVGSTSLVLTLLADAMAAGSWAAVVGMPEFGALAAGGDYGIDLSCLPLVPYPGEEWPDVFSALVDGVDLVVVATPGPVPAGTALSLMSRARRRGCVLIPTRAWPACDLMIELVERRWLGLGAGRGRLRRQEVTLRSIGRGRAAQERRTATSLPPPSVGALFLAELDIVGWLSGAAGPERRQLRRCLPPGGRRLSPAERVRRTPEAVSCARRGLAFHRSRSGCTS